LRARGPVGRHRRLLPAQLDQVEHALLQGAGAHGFASNLWTLERVAEVIWRQTGVRHHPVQVWQPPVLVHPFGWQRASMCAAICAKIGGGGAQVAFDIARAATTPTG
jgi:hypothetical protein